MPPYPDELPTEVKIASVDLDAAIKFDSGVDAMFYSKMIGTAAKYWNAQKKSCDVPTAEALRRAVALIEAIFTEQVKVEQ
jgi:hypothetical protein